MLPVTVQIEHYTVSLGAFASLDPGRAPSQNVQVSLTPVPDPEGHLRQVLLFFKQDIPLGLGWITSTKQVVVGFFPPEAFATFYPVLQGEKPLFVQYTLKDDGLDLASIHLTSGEEPIGEGPINRL
jgi:hypothetical protein